MAPVLISLLISLSQLILPITRVRQQRVMSPPLCLGLWIVRGAQPAPFRGLWSAPLQPFSQEISQKPEIAPFAPIFPWISYKLAGIVWCAPFSAAHVCEAHYSLFFPTLSTGLPLWCIYTPADPSVSDFTIKIDSWHFLPVTCYSLTSVLCWSWRLEVGVPSFGFLRILWYSVHGSVLIRYFAGSWKILAVGEVTVKEW
jgi:hypothetical protein